jgi:peptide deformylase
MKEIVQDGAAVLREIAQPVPEEIFGTPELANIIDDMKKALDPELEGVALAAPQIAVPYRIFIVRKDRTVTPPPMEEGAERPPLVPINDVYINPEIVRTSRKYAKMDEGCLSVRGFYGTARRHERVTIRARNLDGSRFERGAGGLVAQIFEHEIDHLNGILFIDHADHIVHITHEHND